MAGYLGAIPVPQATQHRESFTATSGQTTFNTAGYTVGFLDVYLNGSHLSPADFTATNGSDVVLASGASTGDVCDIISYTAFEVADQTFTGTTTMDVAAITGVLTTTAATVFNGGFAANDGSTISTADNTTQLTLTSTDADATTGPNMAFFRNSSSAADGDQTGSIFFIGKDDAGNDTTYGGITTHIVDASNTTEDGRLTLSSMKAGTSTETLHVVSGNVGIGTSSPSDDVEINTSADAKGLTIKNAGNNRPYLNLDANRSGAGNSLAHLNFKWNGTDVARIIAVAGSDTTNKDDGHIAFQTASAGSPDERMRIDSSGNLLVGATASESGIAKAFIEYSSQSSQYGLELHDNSAGTTATQIGFYKQTAFKGSITTTASSTSYNTSSDYRLKTDAQPITGASDRVLALKPVNFEWISDGTRVDGFLAHEAQAVVPEAVTGTKDGMMDEEYQVSAATGDIYTPATDEADEVIHSANAEQPETLEDGKQWRETTPAVMGTRSVPDMQGIDQSKIVPLLVAALQEALARITALENA